MTGVSKIVHKPRGSGHFWLGLAISAVFLFLAARQVDWARTATTLRSADLALTLLGVALLLATFVVFAFRWRLLLASAARLSPRDTFSYIMIGYLANTVLPMRLGEVARATLLGRRYGVSASLVFGSILLERTLDVLVLLAQVLVLSLLITIPPLVRASVTLFAGGALALVAVLFVLAGNEERLPCVAAALPGFIPRSIVQRLVGLVARFAGGLRTLRDGWRLAQVLVLSGLAWVLASLGTVVWIAAFHLATPWYAGFFVLGVVNLGGAIPSSPGAIGVYHYLAVLALSVWVRDESAALAYAIGTHGVNMVVNIVLGVGCLVREGVTLQALNVGPPAEAPASLVESGER